MSTEPVPDQTEDLAKLRQQIARMDRRSIERSRAMVRLQAGAVGMSAGLMGILVSLALPWMELRNGPATGWALLRATVEGGEPTTLWGVYLMLALVFGFAFRAYLAEDAAPYRIAQVSAYLCLFAVPALWPWSEGMGSGPVIALIACWVVAVTTGRARSTVA